jgi:formate dehydrogenase iron-sulfur subunit
MSVTELGYAPEEAKERVGFFTDTSICIGCKACEVACKEWNLVPEDGLLWTGESYDNTSALGANTWRHVAFIEQRKPLRVPNGHGLGSDPGTGPEGADGGMESGFARPRVEDVLGAFGHAPGSDPGVSFGHGVGSESRTETPLFVDDGDGTLRWLMSSDVCKHCTEAGCLDVCPTGALFRTEFGTVVVQEDVCNGCGYCVPACPFGVLDKRHLPESSGDPPGPSPLGTKEDGRVWKCTLCYDRLKDGHEPACAKACPTKSIQFGPLEELRARADERLAKLQDEGWNGAQLYGESPDDGVGGFGAFFLLLDEPEVYGLPPDPVVPTRNLGEMWAAAGLAAGALAIGVVGAFLGGSR